jgi:uncharacterized membrane protein
MSALIVWTSGTPDGAARAGQVVRDLPAPAREGVHDAALVCWPRGSATPTTRMLPDLASDEALGEGFWGVLFGLIFYSPLLGAAVVSSGEAFSGSIAGFGIADTFVNRARDTVTPGTSALFVLGSDALVDHVRAAPGADQAASLLVTRLSPSQEGALRQVFVG